MNADLPLWIAGVGIILAIPLTFMVANWVRKNVEYGEARFDTRNTDKTDEETK